MAHDTAGAHFLASIRPLLEANDLAGAAERLRQSWPPEALIEMLKSESQDVVRTAVIGLGLSGTMSHCRILAALLKHPDNEVAQLAEDSLWRIWMRAGSPPANRALARGVELIRDERFDGAVGLLHDLAAAEPDFAEAHDQLAIALYFIDRFDDAGDAYRDTLRLNPYHFGAAAGLGHVYVQRGDVRAALWHYRRALEVHPRLHEIRAAVGEIEAALRQREQATS